MTDKDVSVYSEEHKKAEEEAIEIYEKGSKPYRKISRSIPKQIVCQKCGATTQLMKVRYKGQDYWFCKACIMEKARQESDKIRAKQQNKIIGEI